MFTFARKILMIRPANFCYNPQTGVNNVFSNEAEKGEEESIHAKAVKEFDRMVAEIIEAGIDVHVWNDSETPKKPDAVFPNNWFSTTPNGAFVTYPMFAKNRRIERDPRIIDYIETMFEVERRYEFEHYEAKDLFLEGTGSMIMDHDEKVIYACLSARTDIELLDKMSVLSGYEVVAFTSTDEDGQPIYHTNVMMALANDLAIICMESIDKDQDLEK